MIEPKLKPPFRYNFAWENHDFVYCATAKCMSMSMRQMLGLPARDERPHSRSISQAWQYTTRFAIFRHPFNRMVSAWRYGWRSAPWEKFVEHVLRDPKWDIHTYPQYWWSCALDEQLTSYVPNVVVTLETFHRHWDTLRQEHMPWVLPGEIKKNASPPLDYPPTTLRAEIEAAPGYAIDLWYWEYLTNECDGYLGLAIGDKARRVPEQNTHRG